GLGGGVGDDAGGARYAVLGEELLRLEFHQIHRSTKSSLSERAGARDVRHTLGGVSRTLDRHDGVRRGREDVTSGTDRAQSERSSGSSEKCSATQPLISPVVAPGVKTLATPSSSRTGMSSSGMIPPPKSTMSEASRSASSSTSRRKSVMWAPERTERPI